MDGWMLEHCITHHGWGGREQRRKIVELSPHGCHEMNENEEKRTHPHDFEFILILIHSVLSCFILTLEPTHPSCTNSIPI